MNNNTKKLRALMAQHRLSVADVATMLGRTGQTVRGWRTKNTTRPIPDTALELLTFKLQARSIPGRAAA